MQVASTLLERERKRSQIRRRNLQRTVVASVLADIQFWMIQPLVSLMLAKQDHDPTTIGLVASVPWFVVTITAPVMPWIAGRVGAVSALRLSIGLSALGMAGFACFDQLLAWVMANAVLGLGFGLCWVISDSWVSAAAMDGTRGRLIGLYETIASSTMGLGPLLLALVVVSGPAPFFLASALLVCSAAATVGLTSAEGLVVRRVRIRSLVTNFARCPAIVLCAFLCGLLEGGSIALLPVYAVDLGFSAQMAALLVTAFGFGNVLLQYPVGLCCDKVGHSTVQYGIMTLLLFGFAVTPLTDANKPVLLTLVLIGGGLVGALYTTCMVDAGNALRGSGLVGVITAMMAVYTLGSMVGPAFAGIGMSANSEYGLFAAFALAVIGVGLWIVLLRRPRASKLETRGSLVLQEQ